MMISVIIPSYNSWPLIGKTLKSLENQDFDADFEVIVADCSVDGSNDRISEEFPDFTILHKDTHDYPGAARNRAIDAASGDIIAMIDADAEASKNWLSKISVNFKREPEATGFGGAIENANHKIKAARIAHFLEFGGYTSKWPGRTVRMTPTCNLALKKEVLDSAKFLEDWFGNEDVLISREISRMGGKIIFDPEMVVYHYTREKWDAIYEHQRRLGRDTGRARYRYNLPGSWLAHKKGAWLLIPAIKYLLLCKRVFSFDRNYLLDFLSSPQIFRALNQFASGFQEGIRIEKELFNKSGG